MKRSRSAVLFGLLSLATANAAEKIVFRHVFDDQPLDVRPKPGEELTAAVKQFVQTGKNPYARGSDVLAEGKKLYEEWCQSCHLPDGSGRMGPSLVDDVFIYPRTHTDVGMFEAIYGGAGGAMQAFDKRLSQDQILRVMAYIRSLRR
jgi:cytochrome c-L